MLTKFRKFFERLDLSQRFMLAGLVILVGGAIGLGEWVGGQIEEGVIHRTAATTALYVDSFIAPNVQELAHSKTLTQEHVDILNRLLQETPLGQQIVSFRVWDAEGRVIYATEPAMIGQVFPVEEGLLLALQGEITTKISALQKEENVLERAKQSRLLETYSPVRLGGTNQVIAVAEFYQAVGELQREITTAQQRSWLVVGTAMLVMYALLAGFVRRASDTIEQQKVALSRQVSQLTELLAQNESLGERIRRAAARFTTLNERFLRRFSAELHDGPLQDLGLALLRLDPVLEQISATKPDNNPVKDDLDVVQGSLRRAMDEIRSLSAGLGVPHLNNLTLPETLARVVHVHEQRTGSKVTLNLFAVPDQVPLPVKITVYRLVQEALNNAFRHAGGRDQRVDVSCQAGQITVEVSDHGPGFHYDGESWWNKHLGLVGMRERIESLGGTFHVESAPGEGTTIIANLSLEGAGEQDD
jgi:signal transduction histidine kinase